MNKIYSKRRGAKSVTKRRGNRADRVLLYCILLYSQEKRVTGKRRESLRDELYLYVCCLLISGGEERTLRFRIRLTLEEERYW